MAEALPSADCLAVGRCSPPGPRRAAPFRSAALGSPPSAAISEPLLLGGARLRRRRAVGAAERCRQRVVAEEDEGDVGLPAPVGVAPDDAFAVAGEKQSAVVGDLQVPDELGQALGQWMARTTGPKVAWPPYRGT